MWSAVKEYLGLCIRAWWVWLAGPIATLIGYAATAFPPNDKFPIWAWVLVALAISGTAAQYRAYYVVRQQRDTFTNKRKSDAVLEELGALRVKAVVLRNNQPTPRTYDAWEKEFHELRAEIKNKIKQSPGAVEADSFETVGNKYLNVSGMNDAHSMNASILTRDIDWLEAFIARYSGGQPPATWGP